MKEKFDDNTICLKPIGIVHTPFKEQKGTPIQPAASIHAGDKDKLGVVEVFPRYVEGLRDLEGFERIILIYRFHKTCREELTVQPYLDTGTPHGVFATRAPCRPNRIGISCVRLVGIEDNRITIGDVDILDGAPLLDIKPYVPQFDCFSGVRSGWVGEKSVSGRIADERFL